jgi:hypothetical protein
VAHVVYGSIIGLALVVALDSHPPGAAAMDAWLIGTAIAVGLAELYSQVVGAETRNRHRVTRAQLGPMVEGAAAVAFGIAFPTLFFTLSVVGVLSLASAFTVAKWTGLALIGCYGFWAARLAGAPLHQAVLRACIVAAAGAVLITLKSLLH